MINTWSYNIDNLKDVPTDKLKGLYDKYEYETSQLEEGSTKYKQGVEYLVKIQNELDRREQEGA